MGEQNLKLLKIFCSFCLISSSSVFGAIFHSIDTTMPLKCTFSSNHHNRIVVDNSQIKKVVSSDPGLSVNMEPESGQVFIYSLHSQPQDTAISVITKGGYVQDIEISFEERSPEVVILIELVPFEEEVDCPTKLEAIETIDEKIGQILAGDIPDGYEPCTIGRVRTKLKRGLFVEAVSLIRNPFEDIYVYEIINETNSLKEISEKELEGQGSCWIHLESCKIKPKSKAMLVISYRRVLS